MPSKPVQISIDTDLLRRIDKDPEVRERGRSAFVRSAVELYLKTKRRRATDRQIVKAYGGRADEMLDEIAGLMPRQALSTFVGTVAPDKMARVCAALAVAVACD